jgi:UDP-N-acetylmuramoylalanine--D-glutamate ligase
MELKDKKVLVVGFGKTGLSTTQFMLNKGAKVTLVDHNKKIDVPKDMLAKGLSVEKGRHKIETFVRHDLIVISPGVPMIIRPIIEAQARGIEVISEIELAYRFLNAPLIAVTGTNGKTTTTSLLQHIFKLSGKDVFVGGNIGTPLIDYVLSGRKSDYVIAEISSFQLECIKNFKPSISVLLNVTEDHLDRYPSFEDYIYAKSRIFMNQDKSDIAVLNFDDSYVRAISERINAEQFFFTTKGYLERGAYYDGAFQFRRGNDKQKTVFAKDSFLKGEHNRENMLAAVSVALLCGLPEDIIEKALLTFKGLPHRMEFVDEVEGVSFFNDSKGTNVGACIKSLESLNPPIILIAGGKDKGGSYLPLKNVIQKKVTALILIGEAKKRMQKDLGGVVPTFLADTLEKAVKEAFNKAEEGDTVLFSPACSSFDMFKSYEHRGECFRTLVGNLKKRKDTIIINEQWPLSVYF